MPALWTKYYNEKPPFGACKIDRGHPLSVGLVGCWLHNERGGQKVYNLANTAIQGNFSAATIDWVGKGIVCNGDEYWSASTAGANFPFDGSLRFRNGTIAIKYKYSTSVASRGLLSFGESYNDIYPAIIYQNNSGTLRIYFDGDYFGSVALTTNTWYSIATMHDGSYCNLYVNGIYRAQRANATPHSHNAYLYCGRGYELGGSDNETFEYVYVWNRRLSAGEILYLHGYPYSFLEPIGNRPYFVATPPETITLDKWYREASLPRDEIPEVVAYGNMPTAGVAE